jgi:hypothetical protein
MVTPQEDAGMTMPPAGAMVRAEASIGAARYGGNGKTNVQKD